MLPNISLNLCKNMFLFQQSGAKELLLIFLHPILFMAVVVVTSAPFTRSLNRFDRFTVCWTIFNMAVHLFILTPHLLLSFNGPIRDSGHFLSTLWIEFGHFDQRWILGDPLIKAMEVFGLVVLVPCLCALVHAVLKRRTYRGHLQMLVITCDLLSLWILFSIEWFEGAPNLNVSPPYWVLTFFWLLADLFQLQYVTRVVVSGGPRK